MDNMTGGMIQVSCEVGIATAKCRVHPRKLISHPVGLIDIGGHWATWRHACLCRIIMPVIERAQADGVPGLCQTTRVSVMIWKQHEVCFYLS